MPTEFSPDQPTIAAAVRKWMQGFCLSPTEQLIVDYARVTTTIRALAGRS